MPEYVRVRVGADTAYLDRHADGNWSKQIRAPNMSGRYKMILEIGKADGSVASYDTYQNVVVMGKRFDLGRYGKLSETLIKRVVLFISGCMSHVLFEDSTVNVFVRMNRYDASVLKSIEKVLLSKIPAHLSLSVQKLYATCEDIKNDFFTCSNVLDNFDTCQELLDYVPMHFCTCLNIVREFKTCADLLVYPDCQAVMNQNVKDFAICNEITTGFRTCKDVMNHYETCGELQIYTPVEPLGEGF